MEKKKIILLGGLGVIALGAFMVIQKMDNATPVAATTNNAPVIETVNTVSYVRVLTASVDIPMGTRISAEHLSWKEWPEEALNPSLVDERSQEHAVETYSGSVTRTAIYSGEPIMVRKLVQPGDRGAMAALLTPGMFAISTRISVDSAANGFIQPGDRVDVVLTTQIQPSLLQRQNNGANQTQYISETIFENVKVLAIDQNFSASSEGTPSIVGSTALLELSRTDSEVMIESQSKGELALLLRGLDTSRVSYVPSAATKKRKKSGNVTSMMIYRNGQPQRVAVSGQ